MLKRNKDGLLLKTELALSLQSCWNGVKHCSQIRAGWYLCAPQIEHFILFLSHLQVSQTQFLYMCRIRNNSICSDSFVLPKTKLLWRKQNSIIFMYFVMTSDVSPAESRGFSELLLTKHAGSSLATATWNLAQINLSCWEAYIIYNAKTWQKWMALNAILIWMPSNELWKLIVTSQVAKFSLKSELQDRLFLSCPPPQCDSLGLLIRDFAGGTLT